MNDIKENAQYAFIGQDFRNNIQFLWVKKIKSSENIIVEWDDFIPNKNSYYNNQLGLKDFYPKLDNIWTYNVYFVIKVIDDKHKLQLALKYANGI